MNNPVFVKYHLLSSYKFNLPLSNPDTIWYFMKMFKGRFITEPNDFSGVDEKVLATQDLKGNIKLPKGKYFFYLKFNYSNPTKLKPYWLLMNPKFYINDAEVNDIQNYKIQVFPDVLCPPIEYIFDIENDNDNFRVEFPSIKLYDLTRNVIVPNNLMNSDGTNNQEMLTFQFENITLLITKIADLPTITR